MKATTNAIHFSIVFEFRNLTPSSKPHCAWTTSIWRARADILEVPQYIAATLHVRMKSRHARRLLYLRPSGLNRRCSYSRGYGVSQPSFRFRVYHTVSVVCAVGEKYWVYKVLIELWLRMRFFGARRAKNVWCYWRGWHAHDHYRISRAVPWIRHSWLSKTRTGSSLLPWPVFNTGEAISMATSELSALNISFGL